MGKRCQAKDVPGGWLEKAVWQGIERMLKKPKVVLQRMRRRLGKERRDREGTAAKWSELNRALGQMGEERDRVLGLYRRGRISEEIVDRQMEEIEAEETDLRSKVVELSQRLEGVQTESAQLEAAAGILERLGARLAGALSWEMRRELVECLVEQVRVDTTETNGRRTASIKVRYRLAEDRPVISRPARMPGKKVRTLDWQPASDRAPRFEITVA